MSLMRVLPQRNFALLWVGQLISMSGVWVLFIALPFYAQSATGSTLATGLMFISSTLPRVLHGSIGASLWIDGTGARQ